MLLLGVVATGVLGMAVTAILLGRAQKQTVAASEHRAAARWDARAIGEDEAWLRQSPRVNRLRLHLLANRWGVIATCCPSVPMTWPFVVPWR